MSLVVEDGTARSDAESLLSVADATTYHSARRNEAWVALDTADQEAALRKATDYLGQAYRTRWAGMRMKTTQALDWPRQLVPMKDAPYGRANLEYYYPIDVVPTEVQYACAELALKAAEGDLNPDLTRGVLSEKVGQLQVDYDPNSPQAIRYRSIDMLLAPLLKNGGGSNLSVMRA